MGPHVDFYHTLANYLQMHAETVNLLLTALCAALPGAVQGQNLLLLWYESNQSHIEAEEISYLRRRLVSSLSCGKRPAELRLGHVMDRAAPEPGVSPESRITALPLSQGSRLGCP